MLRAFVCVLALLALGLRTASAQDATPISPDAEDCTVETRSIEELRAIIGEPAAEGAGEATSAVQATPEGFSLPVGTPADEATTAEIVAAVHHLTACHNAGDFLAGFSLLTDEFIQSQIPLSVFDADFIAVMEGTPIALVEDVQTTILAVREVTVLDEGRVSALYDYNSPTPQVEGIDGVETDLFIFENVDGVWLLDETIENVEGTHGPGTMATPAA